MDKNNFFFLTTKEKTTSITSVIKQKKCIKIGLIKNKKNILKKFPCVPVSFREGDRRAMAGGPPAARIFGRRECVPPPRGGSGGRRAVLHAHQTRGRAAPAHRGAVAWEGRGHRDPGLGPGEPFSLLFK